MALEVTDARVSATAARLSVNGLRFTGRQLYYAVCRDVEVPRVRVAPGEVGLGAVLVLVGMITGAATRQPVVLYVVVLLGLLLVAVGVSTHLSERRPLSDARPLAISFAAFTSTFLDGRDYAGVLSGTPALPADPDDAAAVVLCDRPETAALVRANREHIPCALLINDITALQEVATGARCVVLHDSAPLGCALAAELRDRGMDVTDAGLNPRDVIGRRSQVLEGAPARLPRDLDGHLTAAELAWLRGGRRVELATLTTEEVLDRLRAALAER